MSRVGLRRKLAPDWLNGVNNQSDARSASSPILTMTTTHKFPLQDVTSESREDLDTSQEDLEEEEKESKGNDNVKVQKKGEIKTYVW